MAKVAAINISEIRGIQKHEIPEAYLKEGWGIEGDAHAGNWHRQVSLLSTDSVQTMQEKLDFKLEHGAFAIGEASVEVTQIGKECHYGCAIREKTGDCVMPREGIFVKVIRSGHVRTGDEIAVCAEQ